MDAHPDNSAVALRPAYLFLVLLIGLHFTVGSLVQLANPAFGINFGEFFFFAGLTWIFTRAQNFRPVEFLALRLPPGRTMFAALGAAIAGFFFAGGVNAINRWLVGPELAKRYDVTGLFEVRSPLEGALLVLGVAVMAPIGEELVFRGYLQRVLGARYGTWTAVVVTSVLFAAIHLNPASVLALFALGVVFALLRVWSGSIWPAILAHAVQNGTSSAMVLSGLAEDSPDELPIGQALILLAVTTPILWLALQHLRRMPAVSEADAAEPHDPEADHRFRPGRVKGLALGLTAAAALSLVALFLVDGEAALARLQRAASGGLPETPDVETQPLPEEPLRDAG